MVGETKAGSTGPQQQLVAYWRDVDLHGGTQASAFYTQDGTFDFAGRCFAGADEIARFYAWRRSGTQRTTRHLVLNVLAVEEDATARLDYILAIFGGAGAPILPSEPPNMIADGSVSFQRGEDSHWFMQSHVVAPVMSGGSTLAIPDPLPDAVEAD